MNSTALRCWRVALNLGVIGVAMLIAACGFQLRGNQVLSAGADLLYMEGPIELRREIEVFLEGSETRLLREREGAHVFLSIGNEVYNRRVLSVDPNSGKEREFELSYSVNLSARNAAGEVLLPQQSVNLIRDYVFDSDQVIGASREEGVLREEMRRDAAQQILFRLRSAAKS